MDREELLKRYPAHRGRLVTSLARLVGPADAEDLANETLLRALASVDGFRGEAALHTWLHRIAVNLAYDLLRRRAGGPTAAEPLLDAPEASVAAATDEKLAQQQMSQCVRTLLAQLPPPQRQMLVEADMLDRPASEIARDAGISAGNAKIRLHRARRAMKAVLETHCDFQHRDAGVLCCEPKSGPLVQGPVSFATSVSSNEGTDPVLHTEPCHAG